VLRLDISKVRIPHGQSSYSDPHGILEIQPVRASTRVGRPMPACAGEGEGERACGCNKFPRQSQAIQYSCVCGRHASENAWCVRGTRAEGSVDVPKVRGRAAHEGKRRCLARRTPEKRDSAVTSGTGRWGQCAPAAVDGGFVCVSQRCRKAGTT
jgi:hypothetical protein